MIVCFYIVYYERTAIHAKRYCDEGGKPARFVAPEIFLGITFCYGLIHFEHSIVIEHTKGDAP